MRRRYLIIFIASFVVFLCVLGGSYIYLNNAEALMKDKEFDQIIAENGDLAPPEAKKETVVNTLLLGIDEARSDTMIVARYNKLTNQISMISIPRDTRVDIPGYGYTKINSAVASKEGAALAMKTVSNLLDIPIHHYVKVDFKGVEKIVDILGGVKINVPKLMKYDDPKQDLHIYIEPGLQVLNGQKSLHFLRYRSGYADADLGRIGAQQEFAKAFINKLISPSIIIKAPSLISTMIQNTKTNIEQEEVAQYVMDINKIKIDSIKMYTTPGEGVTIDKTAYFVYDPIKLKETMKKMNQELGIEEQQKDQATTVEADSLKPIVNKAEIKIEILNSTNTKGLALKLKHELEQKGFKIGKIGDTNDLTYNYSRVIDRSGEKDKLELVSEVTGINMIDSDINTGYDYDITIIVGNDRK